MIKEISFNNFSKARFWINDIPELFKIDTNDKKNEVLKIKSNSNKKILKKEILLELYMPFGPKVDYGILGISTQGNINELVFELFKENACTKVFDNSYVKLNDKACIGLPDEYYNAVKDIILNINKYFTDIPEGKIKICYGAHSLIGSNVNVFRKLILTLIKIAFDDKYEYTNTDLLNLISG